MPCLTGGAPGPAAAAAGELAIEGEPTLGDSWAGVAVWSHWDPASRRYALVQWRGGVASPVAVTSSARIFDATFARSSAPAACGRVELLDGLRFGSVAVAPGAQALERRARLRA